MKLGKLCKEIPEKSGPGRRAGTSLPGLQTTSKLWERPWEWI